MESSGESAAIQYRKMTQMPVGKLIVSLGIPTTITMLITNVYNVADTYFVSKLGESASGATGVVFALMAVIQAIGFMLGQGAGSNISRRLGTKDSKGATKYASTCFFMAVLFSVCLMSVGLIFIDPFMKLLGSTNTILPYSRVYGTYILIAAPAMMTGFAMNNILRFEGKAAFAMVGLTIGGVLNIFGDYILMFKLNMGIAGAGLSTAVSQYISAFILLSTFLRGKTQSKLSVFKITKSFYDVRNIIFTGLPSLIRQGLGSISTMLLNYMAAPYGDGAIAAMSVVARCAMFMFCVSLGIGQGFQPVAAFNYGAKKYSRVKKGFYFTYIFSTIMLGICSALGIIFAEQIISLVCSKENVVRIGTIAFRFQCIALFVVPLSVCGNTLFQSIGKSAIASFLALLRNGICFIPLILILPNIFGLRGIQVAQPLADILSSVITVFFIFNFIKNLPEDKDRKEGSQSGITSKVTK